MDTQITEEVKTLSSLLREACEEDNVQVVKFLIHHKKEKLDLNYALRMAESYHSTHVARLLRKNDADDAGWGLSLSGCKQDEIKFCATEKNRLRLKQQIINEDLIKDAIVELDRKADAEVIKTQVENGLIESGVKFEDVSVEIDSTEYKDVRIRIRTTEIGIYVCHLKTRLNNDNYKGNNRDNKEMLNHYVDVVYKEFG